MSKVELYGSSLQNWYEICFDFVEYFIIYFFSVLKI